MKSNWKPDWIEKEIWDKLPEDLRQWWTVLKGKAPLPIPSDFSK